MRRDDCKLLYCLVQEPFEYLSICFSPGISSSFFHPRPQAHNFHHEYHTFSQSQLTTTTMSALVKVRKAFLKKDPAGLAPKEIELYNQMKEAEGENPEAVEKEREKEKKKQARKEESMGTKEEKRAQRRERGVQQQRERHQSRRDRIRRGARNSATPSTSIPSSSSTTTPTSTPTTTTTSTPPTFVSTTPPSSPPPPYSLLPPAPAAEPPQPLSHPNPPTATTPQTPPPPPPQPLPFFLNTPDENWRYLAWTLAWTLEQGARGCNGMYWMADEEYLEGEIVMDPRW